MSGLPGPSVGLLPALCCADWLVSPPPHPTFGWAHRFVSLAPEDGVGGSPGWSGGSLDGEGAQQDGVGALQDGEGAPQDGVGALWMEWELPRIERGLPWVERGLPRIERGLPWVESVPLDGEGAPLGGEGSPGWSGGSPGQKGGSPSGDGQCGACFHRPRGALLLAPLPGLAVSVPPLPGVASAPVCVCPRPHTPTAGAQSVPEVMFPASWTHGASTSLSLVLQRRLRSLPFRLSQRHGW